MANPSVIAVDIDEDFLEPGSVELKLFKDKKGVQPIWAKLKDEPVQAFTMFVKFLTYPNPREAKAIGKEEGWGATTVSGYTTKFHWFNRAMAYDTFNTRQLLVKRRVATISAQEVLLRQSWADVDAMLQKWQILITEVETPKDLIMLVDARDKIDRMARRIVELPESYKVDVNKMDNDRESGDLELNWTDTDRSGK